MPTTGSLQLVEQRFRLFQIGGVEALGEPGVSGREQLAPVCVLALIAPQPGEAGRGAQFEQLAVLPLSERYPVAIAGRRCHAVAGLSQQIASQTKALG